MWIAGVTSLRSLYELGTGDRLDGSFDGRCVSRIPSSGDVVGCTVALGSGFEAARS
jgi:hypothetical protein